jgi:hypothetical protein
VGLGRFTKMSSFGNESETISQQTKFKVFRLGRYSVKGKGSLPETASRGQANLQQEWIG